MRICLLGPSGSGKTTLANAIREQLPQYVYKENSAGKILTADSKERLRTWGYDGNFGQLGVIRKSVVEPTFGVAFQENVLSSRCELLRHHKNIIADRSPLDAAVYWLNQVAQSVTYDATKQFLEDCFMATNKLVDLIILVPLLNPVREIELNGSRVPNWYFQKKIEGLGNMVIDLYQEWNTFQRDKSNTMVYRVNTWDLHPRIHQAVQYIKNLEYYKQTQP